jgi:hypothetical protein
MARARREWGLELDNFSRRLITSPRTEVTCKRIVGEVRIRQNATEGSLSMSAITPSALFIGILTLFTFPFAPLWSAAQEPQGLQRLAEERLDAARRAYKETYDLYREGRTRDVDRIFLWSQRWLDAEREVSTKKPAQVLALEGHWKRMKQIEDLIRGRYRAGVAAPIELPAVEYYRLDAEITWLRAKGK